MSEKFLKKCKKAFKNKNLILLNGLYPFDPLIKRKGVYLTPEQFSICDLIKQKEFPFVIEQKINAPIYNHFYIDILVKTKYHLISFEIDGGHHLTNKQQQKRDLKKAWFILNKHEIITVRILNKRVREYEQNPKIVDDALQFLNKKLFSKKNKHIKIAEIIGEINKKIRDVKSKKN